MEGGVAGAHFICRLTDRPASCRCHPNPPLHPPSSISRLQHCKSYSYSVHTGMLNPEVNPTYAEYFDRGVLSSVYLLPAAIIRQGGDWIGGAGQTLWLQKHVRHFCCLSRHLCCITRHLCCIKYKKLVLCCKTLVLCYKTLVLYYKTLVSGNFDLLVVL